MKKKVFSQEGLKLIACVTMLIDHIGAVFVPGYALRIIGRIAFPIYAFLLVEGVTRTRNEKKYGQRLLIGAMLAEIPFDMLFFGGLTVAHQSVMVTLLIGFVMVVWARKRKQYLLPVCICFFAAEFLGTDYGGWGILLIAVFMITMEKKHALWLQTIGMAAVFLAMGSVRVPFLGFGVPIQMFALLSMLPIALYSGEKLSRSKWVQTGFYLFYPVHMAVLWLIANIT